MSRGLRRLARGNSPPCKSAPLKASSCPCLRARDGQFNTTVLAEGEGGGAAGILAEQSFRRNNNTHV
eukprot:2036889-Pleurochrysis_carterae.AAC.2